MCRTRPPWSRLAAWALVMLAPEALIRMFNDEPELIAEGVRAFRLYYAAFFCMSFQFIGQSTFVGLGKSKKAVFFPTVLRRYNPGGTAPKPAP